MLRIKRITANNNKKLNQPYKSHGLTHPAALRLAPPFNSKIRTSQRTAKYLTIKRRSVVGVEYNKRCYVFIALKLDLYA